MVEETYIACIAELFNFFMLSGNSSIVFYDRKGEFLLIKN